MSVAHSADVLFWSAIGEAVFGAEKGFAVFGEAVEAVE
jgi:hypothetical protein